METRILSKVCRICCNKKSDDLVSLLSAENKTIVKKLRACSDITVDYDDLLPKYICKKCLQSLNSAYNFKIQCEYMDQKLREIITNVIQRHSHFGTNSKPDSPSFDESTTEECSSSSSIGNDLDQFTMDDVESIIEEDCVGDGEQVLEIAAVHNQEAIATNLLPKDDIFVQSNVMEFSQKISDIESCGTLPSAKGVDDIIDQEMLSVKSEKVTQKIKRSFKCDTCGEAFTVHAEYNKHTKSHGKNRFQCSQCNRWFAKKYLLNAHQKTHSGIKAFECSLCKKRYTNQGNLDRHIRVFHRKERLHTCTTCQKTFSQLSILRMHQSVHVVERQFCCNICKSTFKTEVHLKLHKKRHMQTEYRQKRKYVSPNKAYKPQKKMCVCKECGKRFTSVALLRSHMQKELDDILGVGSFFIVFFYARSHSCEKKYECTYCKKRFSFQQTLRNHIFVHTGEKWFKCDVCQVLFRQIGHLQGHKLVHSGVKPHTCSVCGKAFALRGNLTVHMRTHTGATPFQCNICPKKYSDSNGLRRHYLVHQRKNEVNPSIDQILEAPIIQEQIIEAPIIEAPPMVQAIFENVVQYNVCQETNQFIPPPDIVANNT